MARYEFASDNTAGAMPEVMDALVRFNRGAEAGYGDDAVCAKAGDLIRDLLDVDAEVRFVASGTAANALGLAALAASHEAVLAHEHAHVVVDETGAPGFFGAGLGVVGLPGASGRIDPAALAAALAQAEAPHWQSPAALSLTQSTEYGAIYAEAELAILIGSAKAKGLKVHLDGARLANAIAGGFDPKAFGRLGVDLLVMGGTKAGSTPTEAIVILDKTLERRFGARMKHAGQLISKARYLAAPWIGMLQAGAWTSRAADANAMAARLAAASPFPLRHAVESNAVFVDMDEPALKRLYAAGWAAYRVADGGVRFMCSWSTTEAGVDELGATLRSIHENGR